MLRTNSYARVLYLAILCITVLTASCTSDIADESVVERQAVGSDRVEMSVVEGEMFLLEHPAGATLASTAETEVAGDVTATIEQMGDVFGFNILGDWDGLVEVRLPTDVSAEDNAIVLLLRSADADGYLAYESTTQDGYVTALVSELSQFKVATCVRTDWARLSKCLAKAGVERGEILRLVGQAIGDEGRSEAEKLLTGDLECVVKAPGEVFFSVCPVDFDGPYSTERQPVFEKPSIQSDEVGTVAEGVVQVECWTIAQAVGDYDSVEQSDVWFKLANSSGWVPAGRLYVSEVRDQSAALRCATDAAGSGPVIKLSQGAGFGSEYWYSARLSGFSPGALVTLTCHDSLRPTGFETLLVVIDEDGRADDPRLCFSVEGVDHWVTGDNIESNRLRWEGASTPTSTSTNSTSTTTDSTTTTELSVAKSSVTQPSVTESPVTRSSVMTQPSTTRSPTTKPVTTAEVTTLRPTTTTSTTTTTAVRKQITLTKGALVSGNIYYYSVRLTGFPAGTVVEVTCKDTDDPDGFGTAKLTPNEFGSALNNRACESGNSPDHWVFADGVVSNIVKW